MEQNLIEAKSEHADSEQRLFNRRIRSRAAHPTKDKGLSQILMKGNYAAFDGPHDKFLGGPEGSSTSAFMRYC